MELLTPFLVDDQHSVLIEALPVSREAKQPENNSPYKNVSRDGDDDSLINRTTRKLSDALGPIRATSESILNTFRKFDNPPDEVEVELGVTITTEAGVIITKGSLEGNFKITLKWKKESTASPAT